MSILLKAKPILDKEKEILKVKTTALKEVGVNPLLKIITVGENQESIRYTANKKRFAESIGINCDIENLSADITSHSFEKIINDFNHNPNVHGQIIQLPIPKQLEHLNLDEIIFPSKDVDGFHHQNFKNLFQGKTEEDGLVHCTPKGILTLIKYYKIPLEGRNVAVIGRGPSVGKPLSLLLSNYNATVTMCHSKTDNLKSITKSADIIITAVGNPKYITEDYLKADKSQVIIDVGISMNEDGSLSGDANFEQIRDCVHAITPVPGGVGPLTVLSLMQNLIYAAESTLKR